VAGNGTLHRGEDVSAALIGVGRLGVDPDVNEVDEATSNADRPRSGRGEHPGEGPPAPGVKAGAVSSR